jgi:uncharacterized membrane protein required for colicin V production
MNMKWIAVIVLVIIGVLAAFVAIEYLTVAIHALPSYIPGHKAGHGHGHYRKRGAFAALIALIAFVVAGYLAYRIVKVDGGTAKVAGPASQPTGSTTDQLLGSPAPAPGEPVQE